MPEYLLGPVIVVMYGIAALASFGLVLLAGKVNSLGYVPGVKFALVGLGYILLAALTVGVTMYAQTVQPEWWHKGEPGYAGAFVVSLMAAICVVGALGMIFKDTRR